MAVRSTRLLVHRFTSNETNTVYYTVPVNYTVLIKDVSWSTDGGSAGSFLLDLLPAGQLHALTLLRIAPVGAAPLSGGVSRWNVATAGDVIRGTVAGSAALSLVVWVSGAALLDF